MTGRYRNRVEAGRLLADYLVKYAERLDVIVLALPRGGVPVAYEVAYKLNAPLEVLFVRKLGVPGHEEYAMGALAGGEVALINEDVVRQTNVSQDDLERVIQHEKSRLRELEKACGAIGHPIVVGDKTVILVDDGLATGATMKAAVKAVKAQKPRFIVAAVPVGPNSACEEMEKEADEVVCPLRPDLFFAVGQWYKDFSQTSDDEVRKLLERTRSNLQASVPAEPSH